MKELKVDMGTFLLLLSYLFSNLFTVGIGRMLNAIKDDRLGAFLNCILLFKLIIISSFHPAKKICQWLAAPDSSRNQNEARAKYQVNTCAWFLEGERFRVWQENPGFLWIKGKRKFLHLSILNLYVHHL